MNKQAFIQSHVVVCQAGPARKYDNKKPTDAFHSLEYSRRKCAKKLWHDYSIRKTVKAKGRG